MEYLKELVIAGVAVGAVITLLSKVPNDKIYSFGFNAGKKLNSVGMLRLGSNWVKLENLLINSGGYFFSGLRDGLLFDNNQKIKEPIVEKKKNVRT